MQVTEEIFPDDDLDSGARSTDKYFHGGHWGQCLELVSHLCQYGDSVLLVTGPQGVGKTCLKQALMSDFADRFKFCEIQATEQLSSDELKTEITQEFSSAEVHNHANLDADQVLVLLIDDAETLNSTVLSTILQLKDSNNLPSRLHIVLFADATFESRIARSPLKDKFAELVHTVEIEPLTLNEMEAFVAYLQQQETTGDLQIDKVLLKKIYSNTNGIPGKVRDYTRALVTGQDVKTSNMNSKRLSPFSVGLTVAFGLLFCLLAFLWPTSEPDQNRQPEIQTVPDISADLQPEFEAAVAGLNAGDIAASIATADINSDLQAAPTTDLAAPQDGINPASQQPSTAMNTQQEPHEYDSYAEKIERLESKLLSLQQQVEKEQQARQVAEQKVADVLHKARQEYGKPLPADKSTISKKSKTHVSRTFNDEKYLLGIPGSHYTLQLVASSKESKIKEFIKQNKLGEKAKCFRSTYKGKPWYIVVYGNYSTRADAVAALSQLPLKVKQANPWPREISSVHNTIKKQ